MTDEIHKRQQEALAGPVLAVCTALDGAADSAQRAAKAQAALAKATAQAVKAAKNAIRGFDELHLAAQDEEEAAKKSTAAKKSGGGSGQKAGQEAGFRLDGASWDGVKLALETLYAPAIESWQRAFAQIREAAQDNFARMGEAARGLWDGALWPLLQSLGLEVVPGIVNSISQALAPLAGGAGAGVLTALGAAFETLCGLFQNLYDTVLEPVMTHIGTALSQVWQQHAVPVFEALGSLLAEAGDAVAAFWTEVVAPLLDSLVNTFGPVVAGVLNAAGDVFAGFLAAAADVLGGVVEALRGVVQFLQGVFTGDWRAAWEGVKGIFAGVWDAVTALAKSAVNGIIGCVNALLRGVAAGVNGVAGALNAIRVTVPDWVPVYGGRAFGINLPTVTAPQIPYLAKGAVIPPNAAFLAVLGDQKSGRNLEAPERLLRQIVREESAGAEAFTASQPVELSLDGEVFYRAMMEIQARRGVRMGGAFADAR